MSRTLVTGNLRNAQAVDDPNFHPTCYAALPPLWVAEGKRLPRAVIEPACGNGAIAIPLRNRGFTVVATDLHDWGCPVSTPGIDFLGTAFDSVSAQMSLDHERFAILTNPPFNIIVPFVERAVTVAPYVAMLARFNFFESMERFGWFTRMCLQRVHLIVDRLPMMHRFGYEGPKIDSSGLPMAWFIFEPGKRALKQFPVRPISWKQSARKFPQMPEDDPPAAVQTLPLFRELVA